MRFRRITALLTVCAVFCGCGNAAPGTTAAPTVPAVSETEAAAPETTETEAADETEAPAVPESGRLSVICWDTPEPEKLYFYAEDAEMENEFTLSFDYAYVSPASEFYDDSFRSPDKFDLDNFTYLGTPEITEKELVKVRAGDTFGKAKIKSAKTELTRWGAPDSSEYYVMSTDVVLDGEYELTGIIRYYYDEEYAISAGDLCFTPDESYAGLPLTFANGMYTSVNAGVGITSDNPRFHIGNLLDGAGNPEGKALDDMYEIFGAEKAICAKQVKITLTDIDLQWNDSMSTMFTCAKVVSVKEI